MSFTQARAVNNKGLVTGFRDSAEDQFFAENGFIYDPKTGEFTDIAPSLFTIAQGINNKDEVVGSSLFFGTDSPCGPTDDFIVRFGWVRASDGTLSYFSVNGYQTSARGITDSGAVSGFANTSSGVKAFVVKPDGSQCQEVTIPEDELFSVSGKDVTVGASMSDSGVVAGGARLNDGSGAVGFVAVPEAPKSGKKK